MWARLPICAIAPPTPSHGYGAQPKSPPLPCPALPCSYELPWEDRSFEYPASLAPPLQILIDASNGASINRSFLSLSGPWVGGRWVGGPPPCRSAPRRVAGSML